MRYVSKKAFIGSAFLGENVIVLGPSVIGDDSIIDEYVILGYPVRAKFHSFTRGTFDKEINWEEIDSMLEGCELGKNVHIRSWTVIYEKSLLGNHVETGHNVLIRENTVIGEKTIVGSGTIIDGNVVIGSRVRIESGVYIPPNTTIGNNVFIGPRAVFTNDKYPASKKLVGAKVGDDSVIGANSTIIAGINIGEGAVIAAGSVVTRDVPPFKVVAGVPARIVGEREEYEEKKRLWEKVKR